MATIDELKQKIRVSEELRSMIDPGSTLDRTLEDAVDVWRIEIESEITRRAMAVVESEKLCSIHTHGDTYIVGQLRKDHGGFYILPRDADLRIPIQLHIIESIVIGQDTVWNTIALKRPINALKRPINAAV